MSKHKYLKEWMRIVSRNLPDLSLPEVSGLATWSFGMVMTRSSSLTRVSEFIGQLNQEKTNTVRQRLKEWYQNQEDKKGKHRRQLEVKKCFAPLLRWIISLLPPDNRQLPLALDATNIGQNFTVLSINVLIQGCGIPIGWKIIKGTDQGSWKPYWQELLSYFIGIIPYNWLVIVTADRGLYASWLFAEIVRLGWHPFLRINHQGRYRLRNQTTWLPLGKVVSPGVSFSGLVTCFPTNPLDCTLLACWTPNYEDPWLILTDLTPDQAPVGWYGFRCWIESSYRDFKSDGWQWHKTRLRDPQRAERHWLAMAVATLWMVVEGIESHHPQQPPDSQTPLNHRGKQGFCRSMSVFLTGLLKILASTLNGLPLVLHRLCAYSFLPLPLPNSS